MSIMIYLAPLLYIAIHTGISLVLQQITINCYLLQYKLDDWRWQDRYKAILVAKDSYLLKLSRYVVLHPLRAGMVKILINGPRVVIKLWLEKAVAQRGYKPTGYWGSLVNNES